MTVGLANCIEEEFPLMGESDDEEEWESESYDDAEAEENDDYADNYAEGYY